MSPSHSFFVAHQRELFPPSSSVMSIRLSPAAYRFVSGTGPSLILAVRARRDLVVEGEGAPGEPSARRQRPDDAFERAAAVGPGLQVQERAEGAVDQLRRLIEVEVAHVALAQVKLHTRLGWAGTGLLEHRRGTVDVDDSPAACATAMVHRDGSQLGSRREMSTPDSGSGRLMCLTGEMRHLRGRWFEPRDSKKRHDRRHDHG